MENLLPDYITKALKNLEQAIYRDSYNLARDDHDAISMRIKQLKDFIQERYEQRRSPKQ